MSIQHHIAVHIVNRLNLQATLIADVDVVLIIDMHQCFSKLLVHLISILDVEIPPPQCVRFVILFFVVLVVIEESFQLSAVGDIDTHEEEDATIALSRLFSNSGNPDSIFSNMN